MEKNASYRAILIDDEMPARDLIKAYLKDLPQISIVGECTNGFEALKMIQELNPDILFLDVQMPKITGLELLEVLDKRPAVIFTTAFDQYALKAFEMSAVDYLLKPFSKERFNQSITKTIDRLNTHQPDPLKEWMETASEDQDILNRVVTKAGSNIVVIPVNEIQYIEAQEDFVLIYTEKGRYSKSQTMKFYENHLPKEQFVRIHRSYIVNIEKIERLESYDKENYLAIVHPNTKLKVSRSGYKTLRETLKF